jgi:hypothetical protein
MAKRMFSVLFLAVIAAGVGFAQTEADFNVTLTDDGTGVKITGYTGKATALKIPATIQGMQVKEIEDGAFYYNDDIFAETNPPLFTAITLPAGLVKIGGNAFYKQKLLSSIIIPDSVVEIGSGAFADCYDDGIRNFKNIPPTGLKSVTLSKNLSIVESSAFSGCCLLASVTIPQGVKVIGYGTFANCKSLKSIVIPDSVTEIGRGAFGGTGLDTLTLSKGITIIPSGAFTETNLKTLVIHEGVTKIESSAFSDCTALTSVSLPSTIKELGLYAFATCPVLVTVTIPDSLTSIEFGDAVFQGCPKLNLASQAALKRRGYTDRF